ncbi:MAG: ABC transporter ATP-binding protein [Solirubrobacteraceae bacterium]
MTVAAALHTLRSMAAIEVEGLFKSYGVVDAVRGISFRVDEGEVFALLGPNGAGKTTTLEILEGHRRRSGGQVSVLGIDPEHGGRALRERIGIVLESAGIDGDLTVREVLTLYAGCYPRPLPVAELIALVGLQDKRSARVKTLSGGQRRRLDLALALVGDPDLIFLDEPTTGFDPAARHGAWQLVKSLRGLGRTIILTSHYMDEVQHLADRAIVLAGGRIIAEGTPDSLGGSAALHTQIRFRLSDAAVAGELPEQLGRVVTSRDGEIVLQTSEPTRTLLRLCRWAVERDVELHALEVAHPSLEEVYLQLTQSGHDGRT